MTGALDTRTQPAEWPSPPRVFRNAFINSERWNDVALRDDDIIITTWSKSGTTWTQQIVAQLLFGGDPDVYGQMLSPWIDGLPMPDPVGQAAAQTHRRFLKSHLPADALPYHPSVRYIYIARDGRDVFWSWHHHYTHFRAESVARLLDHPEARGELPAPMSSDIRTEYRRWIEHDSRQPGGFWDNVASWWKVRHLPNVLMVHFDDLKANLRAEVERIARFIGVDADDALLDAATRHSGFDHMKKLAAREPFLDMVFEGGGASFINKGTNGRWRDVLGPEDVALCDAIAREELDPDCVRWLQTATRN